MKTPGNISQAPDSSPHGFRVAIASGIFYPWSIAAFVLLSFLFSFLFHRQMIEPAGVFDWLIPASADLLFPLLAVLAALILRNPFCAVLSAIFMVFALTLKLANLILFMNMKEPLIYPVCRMLLKHTEHEAIAAQLGPAYPLWLIPLLFGLPLLTLFLAFQGAAFVRRKRRSGILETTLICALFAALCGGWRYETNMECLGKGTLTSEYAARPLRTYLIDWVKAANQARIREKRPMHYGFFPGRLTPESKKWLKKEGILAEHSPDPEKRFAGIKRIIIIAVESLDLAFIHACAPDKTPPGLTPFLDHLVRTRPLLTHYFTGAQPTSFGFTSMVLSRFDFDAEPHYRTGSLTRSLAEAGYVSRYFSPTNGVLFNNRSLYSELFHFDSESFLEDFSREFGTKGLELWGMPDSDFLDCAATLIEQEKAERSITFISTMDLHPKYTFSGPRKNVRTGSRFLNALTCTDANLERFLARLMANPEVYNEHTLILLTADHSATHGENYTHRPAYNPDRIPLIFITKRPLHDLPLDKYCSQIDLPATLLTQLGLPVPDTFIGQDIFAKKSFALSWSPSGAFMLHRPDKPPVVCFPESDCIVPSEGEKDPSALRALTEFYERYYGSGTVSLPETSAGVL